MSKWNPTTIRFHGHLAVRHSLTREICLASKQGEIWDYGSGWVGFLVRTTEVAKKVAKSFIFPHFLGLKRGEEVVGKLPLTDLPQLTKLLKIKRNRLSMARWANEF